MTEDKKIFDDKYIAGTETIGSDLQQVPAEPFPKIETEKYGTGKPKRITIRGKIIHDKNDES